MGGHDDQQAAANGVGAEADGEEAAGAGGRTHPVLRVVRVVVIGFVLALLGLLVWQVAHGNKGASFVRQVSAGKQPVAPAFTLPFIWRQAETWGASGRLAGRSALSPDSLRGQLVVVNFWASWCTPCKAEAPLLRAAANRYQGKLLFLGIDSQDGSGPARAFLRHFKTNYPSLRDGPGDTFNAYGLTGFPETFYLDRAGRVVAHDAGPVTRASLASRIRDLLRS